MKALFNRANVSDPNYLWVGAAQSHEASLPFGLECDIFVHLYAHEGFIEGKQGVIDRHSPDYHACYSFDFEKRIDPEAELGLDEAIALFEVYRNPIRLHEELPVCIHVWTIASYYRECSKCGLCQSRF